MLAYTLKLQPYACLSMAISVVTSVDANSW